MRCLLAASTIVLACCAAPSAAEDKGLSGDRIATDNGTLVVHPLDHATFVMQWNGKTVYVDPVGGKKPFADRLKPDLVLVTHAHFDHFDPKTLEALVPADEKTTVVAPKTVAEKIPESLRDKVTVKILANGEKTDVAGIEIQAVPAYNTSPGKEKFHPKGRDNGYVLSMGGKKVYVAGDTENTPEMRTLKGIDMAFLAMNLPYTMSVEKAAEAIRQFKPKIVYPYHYRSQDGTKADFEKLKKLVGDGTEIRVREWYPVSGGAREPSSSSTPRAKGFASPNEAWGAYVKGGEARDWAAVYDCCTPAAQDAMTFDCLLGLKFGVAWFSLEKSEEKDLRDLVAKCDRLYAAHGIDWKRLEKEAEKAEKADLSREDLQELCLPLVKDKRRFFAEATALTVAIQEVVSEKLGKAMGEKPSPEEKAAPEEAPPPDLDKLVKVKVRGDRATGQVSQPVQGTLIVAGKRVRYQTETKFFRRIDGRWYVASEKGEPVEAPLHKIANVEIPYEKQFMMEAGDVLCFELPGGKVVAVWCEGGAKSLWAAEQSTDSGLKTSWGEKPFRHVGYRRERQPDGSTVLGETTSYIKQGAVTTSTGTGTSTYQLFVGMLEFSIIEDLRAKEKLPVTIRVARGTEGQREE